MSAQPLPEPGLDARHLGRPIGTFKPDSGHMFVTLLLSLLVIGGGTLLVFVRFILEGPAKWDDVKGKLPYLALGWVALVAVVLVVGLRARLKYRKMVIQLYPRALLLEFSPGRQMICPWSDVQSVEANRVTQDNARYLLRIDYKITRKDGSSFQFTAAEMGEQQLETLDRHMKEKADRGSVAPLLAQVNSAEGVKFKWLTINRKGMHNGAELLRWSDVKRVEASDGGLLVHRLSGQQPWELTPDLPQLNDIAALIRIHANLRE